MAMFICGFQKTKLQVESLAQHQKLQTMAEASDTDRISFYSHAIERYQLKPGDHIYAYRAYGLYQHHGIYIGKPGRDVIHFSGTQSTGKSKKTARVRVSTLGEFLAGYELRLVIYGEKRGKKLFKRDGTSHKMVSRPASEVINTAEDLALHPKKWKEYNLVINNCEKFAMYCKTGDKNVVSGQVGMLQSIGNFFSKKKARRRLHHLMN